DRFESLLTDLLEISRYDARVATPDTARTDLAALVRSEVHHVEPLAAERGCLVRIDGVPTSAVYAEVDARRVARIVRNLLSNAVEHGEGSPIEVDLVGDEHAVGLRVRDHGVGLQPGEAGLVFGRFWRGDPSRARRTGGTGLGLAIALEDARLHGGWLQAWGEPGRGAAFRLVLPIVAGAAVRHAPLSLEPTQVDA
ncbi:MAG TPA: HAMP domain-containing sensor histidine kinase, partial [Mycobacteriales bacterium]